MTQRTHALVFASLWFALSNCAPNPGPLFISKFIPIPDDCAVGGAAGTTEFLSAGSLDVTPGAPHYFVSIELQGGLNIINPPVIGAGQTLENGGRDHATVNDVVITYSATPKINNLPTKEYHQARNIVFDPNTSVVTFGIDLLSPEASQALEGVDSGKLYRLLVSVTANGFMSGSASHITTGPSVYPITVTKQDIDCGASVLRTLATACKYSGQDTGVLECCPAPSGNTIIGCPP